MAGGRQLLFISSVNTEVQLRKQLKSFTNNFRETKMTSERCRKTRNTTFGVCVPQVWGSCSSVNMSTVSGLSSGQITFALAH